MMMLLERHSVLFELHHHWQTYSYFIKIMQLKSSVSWYIAHYMLLL